VSRSGRFSLPVVLNLIGFGLMGISGLVLIVAIAQFYPTQTLGTFNLAYSFYVLFSQLVGGGVHFSVLRYVGERRNDINDCAQILRSALYASMLNALVWITLFVLLRPLLLPLFSVADLGLALWYVTPSLLFVGLNKVMLNYLNAREQLVSFALMNSARALVLMGALAVLIKRDVSGPVLPLILSITEVVLFLLLFSYLLPVLFKRATKPVSGWIREHLRFGYRSMVGSVFIDINTRIDVLILGLFVPASSIGIYSFAAMLVDGFYQLSILMRILLNPKLVFTYFKNGTDSFQQVARHGRNLSYLIQLPIGVAVVSLYLPVIDLMDLGQAYTDSFLPFAILMAGLLLSVGYAPLLMLFNQTGMPGRQSCLYILIFVSNLLLNLMLVPSFGILGSAAGTALSFVTMMIAIQVMGRVYLKIRI